MQNYGTLFIHFFYHDRSRFKFTDVLQSSPCCYWVHQVYFQFWFLCFSVPKFPFYSDSCLLFPFWNVISFHLFQEHWPVALGAQLSWGLWKSLSHNSNIWVIFALVSVDCLFPWELLRFFFILHISSNFLLYPGYF